jgi:integrase
MSRNTNKLSALKANTTKPGRYGDGAGLYLVVSRGGGRKWVFRFTLQGKVNEMGLGPARVVSLADARAKAAEARRCVAHGKDPIQARAAAKGATGTPSFGTCADQLIAAKESGWRNAKHRQQWKNTLRQYAATLWDKPVDTIGTADVLTVLQPIWQTKAETASRVRGRIEAVLDAARAKEHIPANSANPARWRGHLDKLLAKRGKLTRGHHRAMAYADVPGFVTQLRERSALAALALEFIVLTAARSGEALGARWCEIDLKLKIWTVPGKRMKRGVEHRVPLVPRAIAILDKVREMGEGDLVFPTGRPARRRSTERGGTGEGAQGDHPMSNMACSMLLRRMKVEGVTVHGFRSSFRDWAGDCTAFPRELAEAALAHAVGDATELAYRRGDALEKRRKLMEAWAAYLSKASGANVIPLQRA